MKRFATLLAAALLLVFALVSCGSSTTSSVSLYDLQKEMLAADDTLPEMKSVSSSDENAADLFAYLSDMDYDTVSGFFLSYCADGSQADEIAVIELKNSSDKKDMLQSIQDHVEGRVNLYASYGPDQVQRAENALIFDDGNYVVLIISDQQDQVKAAFEDFIHQ
jgi:hypothetical protein